MMESETYDIYIDEEGDFLEVSFGISAEEGTTDEIEEGIFVTRDIGSDRITNIGILGYKKRLALLDKILDKFNKRLPVEIRVVN
ncbi:MAG: hypothetical protein AABX29_05565 [Nanoarchaeota archaeon]